MTSKCPPFIIRSMSPANDVANKYPALRRVLSTASFSILCFSVNGSAIAEEAATKGIDQITQSRWIPKSQLSEEQQAALPTNCTGLYRLPVSKDGDQPFSHADNQNQIITILADRADFKENSHLYLEGDISITGQEYQLFGEKASINQDTGEMELAGAVKIGGPGVSFEGDSAEVNSQSETFTIKNASFLVHEKEIRGDAKDIVRQDANNLIISEGNYTTCLPDDNAWSFTYSSIHLNQEAGQGTATHTRLNIKDVPVLYLPWFSFPIDERRKSGFLYPSIGSSSSGSGIALSTPYYFNTAPNYDFTLTPHYVHGRGLHTELEGRHLASFVESRLAFGYLDRDSQFKDDHPGEEGKRWGVDLEQSWAIESMPKWRGEVDYSAVSDEDYLRDLNTGLRITPSDHINRSGKLSYIGDDWHFNALVQSYQTVEPDIKAADRPYQRLPEIDIATNSPLRLLDMGEYTGLELNWESEFIYFYRDSANLSDSDQIQGSRFRHQPTFSLPFGTTWGYLTPSATLDHTDYWLEDTTNSHLARTVTIYDIDAGLYFDKSFGRYRHSVEPRIHYVYSDAPNQSNLPNFDTALADFSFTRLFSNNQFVGGDRIADANQLAVGVTNRLSSNEHGRDLAVLSLGQIYFYDEREVDLEGTGASSRSDSLVAGELLLNPSTNIDLTFSTQWDERTQNTYQGHSALRFHTQDYDTILNLGHRYTEDILEQFEVSGLAPINDSLSIFGRWHFDMTENRSLASLAGIAYESCCWGLQVMAQSYLEDDNNLERSILFQFQLKGIGRFGTTAEEIDKHIPGYLYRD